MHSNFQFKLLSLLSPSSSPPFPCASVLVHHLLSIYYWHFLFYLNWFIASFFKILRSCAWRIRKLEAQLNFASNEQWPSPKKIGTTGEAFEKECRRELIDFFVGMRAIGKALEKSNDADEELAKAFDRFDLRHRIGRRRTLAYRWCVQCGKITSALVIRFG